MIITKPFKTVAIHVMCWSLYLLMLVLGTSVHDEMFWAGLVANNLPVLILFYASILFIFPRYLRREKTFLFIVFLLILNIIAVLLRFALLLLLTGGTLSDLLDAELGPRIFSMLRINILFTGASLAYWYGVRSVAAERERQQLEKEIANARLKGLMNQINPHFLYNTLSFLYTKSLSMSKELADAIGKLSEMMRYSLEEHDEDDKVPLQKEIRHLENFIQIHQLRYDNQLHINFTLYGDPGPFKIMPLLLITFVENAFKHGRTNDAGHPVEISVQIHAHQLEFSVSNRKTSGAKERSSGIGLDNVKARLALGYPELHNLQIYEDHEKFSVHLQLELTR